MKDCECKKEIRIGLKAGILTGTLKMEFKDWGSELKIPALLDNGAFVFVFKPSRYPEYFLSEVKKA